LLRRDAVEIAEIQGGNGDMSVDAFGDAGHFGVAVPVEFLSLGYDHVEECELGFPLDGKGDDAVGWFNLVHYFVELRHLNFVYFVD
jgi:hypothetical protein